MVGCLGVYYSTLQPNKITKQSEREKKTHNQAELYTQRFIERAYTQCVKTKINNIRNYPILLGGDYDDCSFILSLSFSFTHTCIQMFFAMPLIKYSNQLGTKSECVFVMLISGMVKGHITEHIIARRMYSNMFDKCGNILCKI